MDKFRVLLVDSDDFGASAPKNERSGNLINVFKGCGFRLTLGDVAHVTDPNSPNCGDATVEGLIKGWDQLGSLYDIDPAASQSQAPEMEGCDEALLWDFFENLDFLFVHCGNAAADSNELSVGNACADEFLESVFTVHAHRLERLAVVGFSGSRTSNPPEKLGEFKYVKYLNGVDQHFPKERIALLVAGWHANGKRWSPNILEALDARSVSARLAASRIALFARHLLERTVPPEGLSAALFRDAQLLVGGLGEDKEFWEDLKQAWGAEDSAEAREIAGIVSQLTAGEA
jgi:hypothetical protein